MPREGANLTTHGPKVHGLTAQGTDGAGRKQCGAAPPNVSSAMMVSLPTC